jgi:hypothetical protein
MFAHEGAPAQLCERISLVAIDQVVVARLGQTRVHGNAQPAVFNRQVAMYLAKYVGGWSTTRIGRFYNGRDHSTVCHAVKRIEVLRKSQAEVDELLSTLTAEIQSAISERSEVCQSPVSPTAAWAQEVFLTDGFLDMLVDRLIDRLQSRNGEGRDCARKVSPAL